MPAAIHACTAAPKDEGAVVRGAGGMFVVSDVCSWCAVSCADPAMNGYVVRSIGRPW
jgi:hypothetical protein